MKLSVPDYILSLKPYVAGKPLEELEKEFGIKDAVKLASNENPLGPSPKALEAIQQAMTFYNLPAKEKNKQIKRIMTESVASFTHANTARQYIRLYEKMLQRPLINELARPECRTDTDNK